MKVQVIAFNSKGCLHYLWHYLRDKFPGLISYMLEVSFKPVLWIRRNIMGHFHLFLLNGPLIISFQMMPTFFLHHQPDLLWYIFRKKEKENKKIRCFSMFFQWNKKRVQSLLFYSQLFHFLV